MNTATAGAHSVYRFIERTAEKVKNGFRWKTIDYDNQQQYHYNVFNGVGGISFFLAEYYRLTFCGFHVWRFRRWLLFSEIMAANGNPNAADVSDCRKIPLRNSSSI